MKLLFCKDCSDVFSINSKQEKFCDCGKVGGKYTNNRDAYYIGDPILIGFHNPTFILSLQKEGTEFKAFTIKKPCDTFQPFAEQKIINKH